MYRRLILFGLAVCAAALVATMIPLVLSAQDTVRADAMARAADRARAVAAEWEDAERERRPPPGDDDHDEDDEHHTYAELVSGDREGSGTVALIGPGDEVVGSPPSRGAAGVVRTAATGNPTALVVEGNGYAATPAYLDEGRGVVLVSLTPADLREGLGSRLAALALLAALLLTCAAAAAWLLARRTTAPLRDLTTTAHRVADGDLTARAPRSEVPEINDVGVALNRLTGRVDELLAEQRSETAELAHQLRTPLTVLSVDIDAVAEEPVQERLRDDVESLQRMVDEIITIARRPAREGLRAECDAASVVRERAMFWHVLAEDQGRSAHVDVPDGPLPVRMTAQDLAAAVDILLQNVFMHTQEGTAFGVRVTGSSDGARVVVWDEGPGPVAGSDPRAPGTTGLGLSIARRLAQASGGDLELGSRTDGGFEAALVLGPPGE